MAIHQESVGSRYQLDFLKFSATAISDAAASGTLYLTPIVGTLDNASIVYTAPYDGHVLGFSGALSGTLSDGTLNAFPTWNGSAMTAFTAAPLHELATYRKYTQPAHVAGYRFSAGDRIGMGLYQDPLDADSISPETLSGTFLLIVLYEGIEY